MKRAREDLYFEIKGDIEAPNDWMKLVTHCNNMDVVKRIAIYGKGGIGKSTIAANLAAALAREGVKVLQIGCDPKHDSTRLLLDGTAITTALDYLRRTRPEARRLADVVHVGYAGVLCVEAGGPEPGVGCAGRGILSTFELLEQLGVRDVPHDVVLYDVLGDVVCGGFAVPLRREYANVIYVVTSGEFMSIYAANNILRGVANYDGGDARLGGVIFNRRGVEDEEGRVRRFVEAVELPLTATFPRSDVFTRAERMGRTIVEAFPDAPLALAFARLAQYVLDQTACHEARPLTDEALERVVLGASRQGTRTVRPAIRVRPRAPESGPPPRFSPRFLSKSMRFREPLRGCAFAGAVHTTTQIQDAVTLAHGPRSCSFIAHDALVGSSRRTQARYGVPVPHQLNPPLVSSNMSEGVVIFGGTDELEAAIREAAAGSPPVIFVVTTCPAGIIGDDVRGVINRLPEITAKTRIVPILTDGNINGDYTQGILSVALEGVSALIDPDLAPGDDLVNIVAEKNLANNTEPNFAVVHALLDALGLHVNCRFIRRTTVDAMRGFKRGALNLLAYDDTHGRVFRDFLTERFGVVFASMAFPVGFHETARWLEDVAAYFDRGDHVEAVVAQHRDAYTALVDALRPALAGRRIFILTYGHRLDWILETAFDLDMEVVKIAVLDYAQDSAFFTRYQDRLHVEMHYPPDKRHDDISELKPDLVLSNYMLNSAFDGVRSDIIPLCPDVGFHSGPVLAERWYRLLKAPAVAGWRRDAARI